MRETPIFAPRNSNSWPHPFPEGLVFHDFGKSIFSTFMPYFHTFIGQSDKKH